ncbi:MAG: metallophosphoesterase [Actinomycetales bacterium]
MPITGTPTVRRVFALRSHPVVEAVRRFALLVLVALAGATVGWALTPPTQAELGPLQVHVQAHLFGQAPVELTLPPAGTVTFDTHSGPLSVDVSVESIDLEAATLLLESPPAVEDLQTEVSVQARTAVIRAVASATACAVLAAAVAAGLVYRRPRRALQAGVVAVTIPAVAAGLAVTTFTPAAFNEPRFTGLLSRAPYVAGQARSAADRLESYRSWVADLTRSVTTLYATANDLPVPAAPTSDLTTVLHVSDIHLNPQAFDLITTLVQQFGVDAVIDTGDITTWGSAAESATLEPISRLSVPYVFVRGNHDSAETAAAVAAQGAIVLDDTAAEVAGLRIAGIGDFTFTPDGEGGSRRKAREAAAALATTITAQARAGDPTDIALIHNPTGTQALMGTVPLVLSGHMHTRDVRLDATGTRVMVEGSTGGAGITSGSLQSLGRGRPVPLEATLLYFSPDEAGRQRLVAYDEVTVGGLGLASVSVERQVISPDERPRQENLPSVFPQATVSDGAASTSPSPGDSAATTSATPAPGSGDQLPTTAAPPGTEGAVEPEVGQDSATTTQGG